MWTEASTEEKMYVLLNMAALATTGTGTGTGTRGNQSFSNVWFSQGLQKSRAKQKRGEKLLLGLNASWGRLPRIFTAVCCYILFKFQASYSHLRGLARYGHHIVATSLIFLDM